MLWEPGSHCKLYRMGQESCGSQDPTVHWPRDALGARIRLYIGAWALCRNAVGATRISLYIAQNAGFRDIVGARISL